MTDLNANDVRDVVRDEQKHLEKSLDRMAISVEKMADFMLQTKISEKENEQRLIRIHERFENDECRINELNRSLLTITTDVIPELEKEVAKNSMSTGIFWKLVLLITVPFCLSFGGTLWMVDNAQDQNTKQTVRAVKAAIKNLNK